MKKLFFTCLFFLSVAFVSAQSSDSDKIIHLIYPEYFDDISKTEYVAYFDDVQNMRISSVYVYPFNNDSSELIAEINWESEEYSWGNMTEYYILNKRNSNYTVQAKTLNYNDQLYYGGGTQRYNAPQLLNSQLKLSENIKGFAVRLASYHFASQSSDEEIYIYALINNEVKLVLETVLYSGFLTFSLKDMAENKDAFENLLKNPGDYLYNDALIEDVYESFSDFEVLNTVTSGMYDIMFSEDLYKVKDEKIILSKNKYLYKWNSDSYRLAEE